MTSKEVRCVLVLCNTSITLSRVEILSVPGTPEWLRGLENLVDSYYIKKKKNQTLNTSRQVPLST